MNIEGDYMVKNKKIENLISFIKNKKTSEVRVLDIRKISIIADYFVIITVKSMRNVDALENDICDYMSENGFEPKSKEGVHTKWVLIDYNDIIIHIFDEEYKEFYSLDKLWADAKEIEID